MGNNRGPPHQGGAEEQLQQQHSFTQHSEAARKSGHSQGGGGAERAAAPAGAGEHPSSNGGNDHGEVQSGQKPSTAADFVPAEDMEFKQDPHVDEGNAEGAQPEPSDSEPTAHDAVPDADLDEREDGAPQRSSRRATVQGDADTAPPDSGHQLRSSSRLAAQQQAALAHQHQQQQQDFAFRPTRPRTKGSQRPRGNLGLTTNSGAGSEPITPHGPTSGLDSLACAAAWELGEEEDTNMEHPTTTARSSGRETEDQGEYVYEDEGVDGEGDYDEEEDEEEEDEDDEEGGRRGRGHADSRGPAAGTRSAAGSRRPCPRRGGAPRPRDPSAESGQEEAGLVFAAMSNRAELEKCTPDEFENDLVGFLTARGERQLAAHVREKRITCNSLPLDIYGLYKEVVKRGGYVANERYDDKGSRWTGTINFAGDIFPRLKNWTANNRATSVGSQLLNNYRKFLLAYERAYTRWDLPHCELAVQQRAAATAAGSSVQAQAAAIQAAAIAAAKNSQPWEASEPSPSNPPPTAAPPPHRRSAAGSTSAGTKRHAATEKIVGEKREPAEPGNSWQRGPRDGTEQHDTATAMEDEITDLQPGQHGGPMPRAASWAGDRTLEGSGLLSGSKRRRHASSADGTPAAGLPLPLPMSMTSPPTMRKIEHMQQAWTSAHLQVWSSGQAYPSPGSILLVQDPGQPTLQWVVVAADLGDLPLEVAEGGRLPAHVTPQAPRLPMRLMEVSPAGRLEDATPVLLLGSNVMGWVSRLHCRPPTAEALQNAMAAAWMRIASGAPGTTDAEQACVRGLKLALEVMSSSSGMGPGGMTSVGANNMMMQPGVGIPAARNLVQATAVNHTARQLLQLEGAMCPSGVTATAPSYWQCWRDMVNRADSPTTLIAALLTLTHQLNPAHLSAPLDMLWQELLPLLGINPPLNAASSSSGGTDKPILVTGSAGEATCLGVDLAVGLLRANIDWLSVQRVWSAHLMSCQLPSASTPMGMLGIVGNPAGSWAMNLGPMTTPTPMPTPNTLSSAPINVVDRSRSNNDNASRRPLPPVGPTAPPPSGPVGAGFSARMSTQGGAGLPPRPPPVRVTSGMGGPSSGGNTGTGGALSPNSQQNNLSLSPLRLASGAGGAPASTFMPPPALDVKPDATGNQGHMNTMPGGQGRVSEMGATTSRVGSPQPSERGVEQTGGPTNAGNAGTQHPVMMVGSGGNMNSMMSGAAGMSSNTISTVPSPAMQNNAIVFGQPPSGPLAPISAVPLDLSAPGGAASQFGPSSSSVSTFGGPASMMMGGGMMGMGGGMQMGPMGGMMPPNVAGMGLLSPTGGQGSAGPRGPGHMNVLSLPSPQSGAGMLTSPPAVPAQQPIVVRDQSQPGAGPANQGNEQGSMHGMQASQAWGGPMDSMMMGQGQPGPMQMGMMSGMPPPGQQHYPTMNPAGMPGPTLQLGTNPMLLPNNMGPMGQQMPPR